MMNWESRSRISDRRFGIGIWMSIWDIGYGALFDLFDGWWLLAPPGFGKGDRGLELNGKLETKKNRAQIGVDKIMKNRKISLQLR